MRESKRNLEGQEDHGQAATDARNARDGDDGPDVDAGVRFKDEEDDAAHDHKARQKEKVLCCCCFCVGCR